MFQSEVYSDTRCDYTPLNAISLNVDARFVQKTTCVEFRDPFNSCNVTLIRPDMVRIRPSTTLKNLVVVKTGCGIVPVR